MMTKKKILIAVIAIVIISLVIVVFATRSKGLNSKSPVRAKETIEEFLGESVEIKDTTAYTPDDMFKYMASNSTTDEMFFVWTIQKQVKEPLKVLFLYENDSKAIMATHSECEFLDETKNLDLNYKKDKYHNDKNYSKGSFAWEYGGYANAVLSEKESEGCSSIWIYNERSHTIFLVWYNSQAKAWEDYNS